MEVFFGEHITSLRALFKRYCYHTAWSISNRTAGTQYAAVNNKVLPFYRATFDTSTKGVYDYTDFDLKSRSVNPAVTFPLLYCMPAFVGWKGNIRRKAVYNREQNVNARILQVLREPYASYLPGVIIDTPTDSVDMSEVPYMNTRSFNGLDQTNTRNTQTIEFENPFYQAARFRPTQQIEPSSLPGESYYVGLLTQLASNETGDPGFLLEYVSTGEDFTLFWFLNVPPYFRYDLPTRS